jgi:hypothetical protein
MAAHLDHRAVTHAQPQDEPGYAPAKAMDPKSSATPLGGEKTGKKSPADRGKLAAMMNLLVDKRGAPISVVLTGSQPPRRDVRYRSMFAKRAAMRT